MRTKIGKWLILGLLLWPAAAVYAAQPAERVEEAAVSGYCLDNDLYAFVRLKDGYDIPQFTVKLQIDDKTTDRMGSIKQIRNTDTTVQYVFMVDLSGTMKDCAKEINAFLDALTDKEQLKAVYTVATFGEQFQVVGENLADRNALKTVLEELKYRELLTDPYSGMESALTYLDSRPVKGGDLIHLVMITDGEPDLGIADEKESAEREKALAQKLAERISDTPEVIVSTLCTKEWKGNAFSALSAGKGKHETVDSEQAAAAAGEGLAEYVDSLYRIGFPLSANPGERFDINMKFDGKTTAGTWAKFERSLKCVPNLNLSAERAPESTDQNPENPTDTEPGQESEATTEPKPDTESEATTEPDTESRQESQGKPELQSPENPKTETRPEETTANKPWICPLALLVSALLLIAACALFLAKRRKPARAESASIRRRAGSAGAGITMKLEIYSGNYRGKSLTFHLTAPLVIGRSPKCDLVFENPDISPQNSRIFMKNQMIYIEDLNSAKGTALGGMRIQGANRLRSGDVISIGSVEFCFKF